RVSADLPIRLWPGHLAIPSAVLCDWISSSRRRGLFYHPGHYAGEPWSSMELNEEHGQSVAAALHLTAPAALLPAATALLSAVVTDRTGAVIPAVWPGLPARAA